jgi:hypothetical protein
MNDKNKAKLKSGEYILTEKRHAKSEVWTSFREIQAGDGGHLNIKAQKCNTSFQQQHIWQ